MEYINNQPINYIEWIDVRELDINDYNPNVVLSAEMQLLKFSILRTGWIQPLLVSKDKIIIDGFHRYWLAMNDKDMISKFQYKAPACILDLSEPERMMLTVRINRAKGNHIALKMHHLVSTIFEKHGYPKEKIAEGIGATKAEIDLLLQEGVFTKLDIKNHKYSKAWIPK